MAQNDFPRSFFGRPSPETPVWTESEILNSVKALKIKNHISWWYSQQCGQWIIFDVNFSTELLEIDSETRKKIFSGLNLKKVAVQKVLQLELEQPQSQKRTRQSSKVTKSESEGKVKEFHFTFPVSLNGTKRDFSVAALNFKAFLVKYSFLKANCEPIEVKEVENIIAVHSHESDLVSESDNELDEIIKNTDWESQGAPDDEKLSRIIESRPRYEKTICPPTSHDQDCSSTFIPEASTRVGNYKRAMSDVQLREEILALQVGRRIFEI